MKDSALGCYNAGFGCSQCILRAVETKYGEKLDARIYNMAGSLNAGIGIGGMCAVLIASVMCLGLFFDEETAKKRRITFLSEFHNKYGVLDCGKLKASRGAAMSCSRIVYDAADILEKVISKQSEQ